MASRQLAASSRAGVDTARCLFGEKRRKKKEGGKKVREPKRRGGREGRCKSEGLVVESARCYLPCPVVLFPFLFFYLSFFLSLPLFPPAFLSISLFLSNRLLSRKRVSFHFSGGNAAICRSYLVKRSTHASNRKTFRWNTLKRFRHLSL